MPNVECPWCAGPATIQVAERDEFECVACAIQVEVSPEPAKAAVGLAA